MATQIVDALIHVDQNLEKWQRDVLEDHIRLQEGVIATGTSDKTPHLMLVEYNPVRTHPRYFLAMIERHGYHAERVG